MAERLSLVKENWFKEGLRFKCTGCGKCCSGSPGFIWVDEAEIAALASQLQMSRDDFCARFTREVDGRISLIEKTSTSGFDCIFLQGKTCGVYAARPKQCRTYPWWLYNVQTEQAWNEAATECEGINHPDAPLIPLATILEQLHEP